VEVFGVKLNLHAVRSARNGRVSLIVKYCRVSVTGESRVLLDSSKIVFLLVVAGDAGLIGDGRYSGGVG